MKDLLREGIRPLAAMTFATAMTFGTPESAQSSERSSDQPGTTPIGAVLPSGETIVELPQTGGGGLGPGPVFPKHEVDQGSFSPNDFALGFSMGLGAAALLYVVFRENGTNADANSNR